jgi:protein-disulfide isomerase
MVRWLWTHQSRLSRDAIFAAARELTGMTDVSDLYPALVNAVREDIEVGHTLGVRGTPTYFVNGVKLNFVPRQNFEIAILHELRHTGSPATK